MNITKTLDETIKRIFFSPLRPAFKRLTNRNCYDGIKIQGGKHVTLEGTPEVAVKFTGTNYVCPRDDIHCPHRIKDRAYSPEEVTHKPEIGLIFRPGDKYVLCSRKPRT